MKKKSLLCLAMALIILLSTLPVTVYAQADEELAMVGATADFVVPTSADIPEIVSISAGSSMSAAVRSDGSLWTWGNNHLNASGSRWGNHWSIEYGNPSLGIAKGTLVNGTPMMAFSESTKSVKCATNFSDSYYSQGDSYFPYPVTSVLKSDNSLWLWGGAKNGVIGNGIDASSSWKPSKVLENVISYDTSGNHSAAVTSDGSLYMWGKNDWGQLGDGSNESKLSPTKIQGMENVTEVKLGKNFSAALKSDNSLWIWGANYYGQLGKGTADGNVNSVPTKVLDNIKLFALSDDSCAAVKTDGTVLVWGYNGYGELGIGNKDDQYFPVENENLDNDAKIIEAGAGHFAIITTGGDLYLWGSNGSGQLGIGNTEITIRPRRVLKKVKQVALGSSHTIALKEDGTLWSWGANGYGQLGDRSTEARILPVEIQLGRINASFKGDNMPEAKTLDLSWDGAFLYDKSTAYNKDMAISGIVLSEAAYSDSNVFKQFGYKYAGSGSSNANRPAFHIYYRVIWNFDSPNVEIIVAIRGTKDDYGDDVLTDIRSTTDCFDGATNELLNSLEFAENTIVNDLKKDNISISLTKRNTRYFLTGHSLGGACAAKMGISLVEDGLVFPNNVYVYTYASPRCITDYDQALSVPRCFNIINECDITVPNMPVFVLWRGFPIRPGYDKYFFGTDSNNNFMNSLFQLYGEYPGDRYTPLKAHMTPVYLASILSAESRTTVNKVFSRARMIEVHCPVDVEVYDSEGNLCAYTKNGEVNYEKNSTVIILIDGDEKYIGIPDDSKYTVNYVGTDSGTMTINEKIYDLEKGEIDTEKEFNNVILEKNKLFESNIDASDNTENTDLFVIDNEGDKTHSVDNNGKETKIALYEISPNGVHIDAVNQQYDGTEKTVTVAVDELTEGTDYRVIYENNTNVGTATVTVKGINLYEGRVSESFEIFDNGNCESGIQWSLSADGELSITGNGKMADFGTEGDNIAPWQKHADAIKKVVIGEGVSTIGDYAFNDFAVLTEVVIPTTVTSIGEKAFAGCVKISEIVYSGTKEGWSSIIVGEDNDILTSISINYLDEPEPPTAPPTELPTTLPTEPSVMKLGDVDGDNVVSILDATYIQRKLAGLPNQNVFVDEASDTDGDESLSILDATFIQRWLAGLSSNENIGKTIVK